MEAFSGWILFVISAVLVNNIVLVQFLGQCPFLGVSRRIDTAVGMGMAVIFVITLSGVATWMVNEWILVAFDIEYLQTVAFILVIAALVQLVEIVMQKSLPSLYRALGIYLPLITTNCAVLGVALLNIQKEHTLIQAMVYSFAMAFGYSLALVLFASIRERLALAHLPKAMEGVASGLVTAGLLALAFAGFAGLV